MTTTSNNTLHEKETAHKKRQLLSAEQDKFVYTEAAKTTALFGCASFLTHVLLEKYSTLYHTKLRIPHKAFAFAAVVTGAFFTSADRAAIVADQKFAKQYSSVDLDEIDRILKDRKNNKKKYSSSSLSGIRDDFENLLKEHRYKLIGALWGTSMIGTVWYNWRRGDITTAQKLINARMTSQSLALAAFTGFALATTVTTAEKEQVHDPHYDQIVYGTADIEQIEKINKATNMLAQ